MKALATLIAAAARAILNLEEPARPQVARLVTAGSWQD
jgi:hypothetical protein